MKGKRLCGLRCSSDQADPVLNSRGKARIQVFDDLLSCNEIDVLALRRACFHGIPDSPGVRPLCWKILLGEFGDRLEEI